MAEGKKIFGNSLGAYCKAFAAADEKRIRLAIQNALMSGLDAQEVARKVIGSADLNGTDGATAQTRSQILALAGLSLKRRTYKP